MSATPYTGTEPRVFVSYPREDLDLVQEELDRLHDLGIRLDYATDEEPVDPARLQEAAFYIVLVSDSTEDDPHLRKEVSIALQEGKDGLCLYVFDVPLDGPIKLLLKSFPQVKRPPKDDPAHERKSEAYVRRIVQALPEEVKSRPIELPGDDRPAPPPPSRSRDDLAEGVASLGNAKLGMIAVVAVLLVLWILSALLSSGDPDPTLPESPTATASTPGPSRRRGRSRPRVSIPPLKVPPGQAAAAALSDGLKAANEALAAGKPEEAIKALSALEAPALAKNARGRTQAHLLRARALVKTGKHKEACLDFDKVLAERSKDTALLSERFEARSAAGDTEGAIADLGAIIKLSKGDEFAWTARGDYYLDLKRYQEAIADYSEAIKLQPRSKSAYLKRSRAKEFAGDAEGAAADREKSIGR
ncbi:MAG: tetratricopeptide repeat protein [Planctomycetes bacterium]|nr:tetratricopeptide repeat protein [Planctomycetota bacterium]